jgi:ribosomal protein L27
MSFLGRAGFQSLTSRLASVSINSACSNLQAIRFATKKAGGSSKNGRDSAGRRLGLKKFGGEKVQPGNIILRQRGQKYHIGGENVYMSRDHSIHAKVAGWVQFVYNRVRKHQEVYVVTENPFLANAEPSAPIDLQSAVAV